MKIKYLTLLSILTIITLSGCSSKQDLSNEYKEVRTKANKAWNKLD